MKPSVILAVPPGKIFSISYPIGLEYISAILKKNNYDVKILDCSKESYSPVRSAKEILDKKPDIIGLTVYSFSYKNAKSMISRIKKTLPEIKIILGGPHISAVPKFSLQDTGADFAVVGEGENVFLEIIKRIENKNYYYKDINGLAFWGKKEVIVNPGINLVENLDNLPFPERASAHSICYNETLGEIFSKRTPIAPILTSRGCPHRCSFCASYLIHGRNFRMRSAQNVVDEIEFLVKNFGIREICIIDDTFSEVKIHAFGICNEIIKRNLNISWRTAVGLRLDSLDYELLDAFKKSGCYQLSFGIESFSDTILKETGKPILRSHIIEKIRLIKEFEIETVGYFILGLPGETKLSIQKTIAFAKKSDLDFASFTYAIPLPGTKLFNNLYKENDFSSIDWNRLYFFHNNPFTLSEISSKRLKRFYLIAYFSFYLRPRRILRILNKFLHFKRARISKLLKVVFFMLKNVA